MNDEVRPDNYPSSTLLLYILYAVVWYYHHSVLLPGGHERHFWSAVYLTGIFFAHLVVDEPEYRRHLQVLLLCELVPLVYIFWMWLQQ